MTASFIKTEYDGSVTAFNDEGRLVMNFGHPTVGWYFRVKEIEAWLITLEETILKEKNHVNRSGLEGIYFSLKAAYNCHKKEHEMVTEAPTADDLQAYLSAYAALTSCQ